MPVFFFRPEHDHTPESRSSVTWLARMVERARVLARVVAAPFCWLYDAWQKRRNREAAPPAPASTPVGERGIPNNENENVSREALQMGQIRHRLCKQIYAPPYKARLKAFCFVLRGNAAAIQANVIQPTLANDFKAAALVEDLFALAWVHYDEFSSIVAPDNTHGKHSYKESAVINLIQDATNNSNDFRVYVPSLYLDSSAAMSSGATFGFPKAYGTITMSDIAPNAAGVTLATRADEVRQFQAANMFSQKLLVYQATPGSAQAISNMVRIQNPLPDNVDDFQKLFDAAYDAFVPATDPTLFAATKQFVDAMVFWRAPLLLLKQIPSAVTPLGQAAYQAYVTVNARVTAIHEVALLGGYSVTFEDWDSSPFVTAYGLSNPPTARQTSPSLSPVIGFYVDVSAELAVQSETPIP